MAEKIRGRTIPYLRAWRLEKTMQQGELAEAADVSRSTVLRAEAGGIVSFTNIRKLATALDISVNELLYTQPTPKFRATAA